MPSRSSKPKKEKRDFSQVAFDIVAKLTGEKSKPDKKREGLSAALDDAELRKQVMREMGKRGGQKGGKARAKNLTEERRTDIARHAAETRWNKGAE